MGLKSGLLRLQQNATRIHVTLLTTYNLTNMRAFGIEISVNRRRGGELLIVAR